MRTANFKEQVLWPIAYKIGLDPATNFEDDEARAIGTYINAYVRKLWTAVDFPEWSVIGGFVPGAGQPVQTHIVEMNDPTQVGNFNMGKVLSVSLLDPRTTDFPTEIPFTQLTNGLFVGLEHGNQVYIKYLLDQPVFTAEVWNSGRTYSKDEPTYSPVTGQCYKSLINGNQNNDPAIVTGNLPPSPQQLQQFVPGSPGFEGQTKIMYAQMARADGAPILDPPPNGNIFQIIVTDVSGATIGTASHTANGSLTLQQLLSALVTTLQGIGGLSGFTITENDDDLIVAFENLSEFGVAANYKLGSHTNYSLIVGQNQTYIPATNATPPTPQSSQIVLTNQNILTGSVFQFTFRDTLGIAHTASYTLIDSDGIATSLNGLQAAIQAQASTDPVLAQLSVKVDQAGGLMNVSSPVPGAIGFDWFFTPPPDPEPGAHGTWWQLVPFPYDLIDAVVRGANVDILKEWGQYQAGLADEQGIPTELQLKTSVAPDQQFRTLGDRNPSKSRYSMR